MIRPALSLAAMLALGACTIGDSRTHKSPDGINCPPGDTWWACKWTVKPPPQCMCTPYGGVLWQCWIKGDKVGAEAHARPQVQAGAMGGTSTLRCLDTGSTLMNPEPQPNDFGDAPCRDCVSAYCADQQAKCDADPVCQACDACERAHPAEQCGEACGSGSAATNTLGTCVNEYCAEACSSGSGVCSCP